MFPTAPLSGLASFFGVEQSRFENRSTGYGIFGHLCTVVGCQDLVGKLETDVFYPVPAGFSVKPPLLAVRSLILSTGSPSPQNVGKDPSPRQVPEPLHLIAAFRHTPNVAETSKQTSRNIVHLLENRVTHVAGRNLRADPAGGDCPVGRGGHRPLCRQPRHAAGGLRV